MTILYTIETDKYTIQLIRDADPKMNRTSRVHIWNSEKLSELAPLEAALPTPKEKGEDPENDKAYDTYNRTYIKVQKRIADEVVAKLLEDKHIKTFGDDEKVTFRFSRYAGCGMCACSPGVVVSTRLYWKSEYDTYVLVDVHISVKI